MNKLIEITRTEKYLVVKGHASDTMMQVTELAKEACMQVTTLIECLCTGIQEVCMEQPPMKLEYGLFVLDVSSLSQSALFLVHVFETHIQGLLSRYPNHIGWVGSFENHREQVIEKSSFPDWREYLIDR